MPRHVGETWGRDWHHQQPTNRNQNSERHQNKRCPKPPLKRMRTPELQIPVTEAPTQPSIHPTKEGASKRKQAIREGGGSGRTLASMMALSRTSAATPSSLAAATPPASTAARRSAASTRAADSLAMFSMISAYAFRRPSTCEHKNSPVSAKRDRDGRLRRREGSGRFRFGGAEIHLRGRHFLSGGRKPEVLGMAVGIGGE